MKVLSVERFSGSKSVNAIDCFVDNGYIKSAHGSLPDVDIDFASDRREDVKAYLERRYNHDGKQRVFSAGTFTTLQVKAVIKDVCRVHRVSQSMANYITAIIGDDDVKDWTDLMKLAFKEKKMRDFIQKHWDVFEELRPIMFQPRSQGIHASAVIVVPDTIKGEDVDSFDIIPIRKMDGLLVSELSGVDLDDLGLLKNDVLATKELSRLKAMMEICNREYGTDLTLDKITSGPMDEPRAYEVINKGLTQGVFQLSSDGMTKFAKSMHPENMEDITAANALFRPATLDSGAAGDYVRAKNGLVDPEYLWGTYDILKDTFGVAAYQEQYAALARKIGNLSLGEGVNLVKAISKKKVDKIRKFKDKFYAGAKKNGCPDEVRDRIWEIIEGGASYGFNKCIAGDEYLMRSDRKKFVTVEEMYLTLHDSKWAKEHGHKSLHDKFKREGYGNGMSMFEDGRIYINKIVDIQFSGVRPVYRVTLDNGKSIQLTGNHKCPTQRGNVAVSDLVVDKDQLYVCCEYQKDDTVYRFTDKGKLNNTRYHSNDWVMPYKLNSEKGHCGFTKRKTYYTMLEEYRRTEMKDHCEICGASGCRLEIHHKNGDHSFVGRHYENLITLCPSCHKKEHYKKGRAKRGEKGYSSELHFVTSVTYVGEKPVYDIEMADPNHNFANSEGVITCNSHAVSYGATAYVGAYLKALYPVAFYTVLLKWGKDENIAAILNEIKQLGGVSISQPDINISTDNFETNYQTNEIYWSLLRVKFVGVTAVDFIVSNRKRYGQFTCIEEFIERIFKHKFKKKYQYWDDPDDEVDYERCPVNARMVRNLIVAGAFDKLEHVTEVTQRYDIIVRAAKTLGFEIPEKEVPEDLRDKHWFWSQQQINLSGFGTVDYERIYNNAKLPASMSSYSYFPIELLADINLGERKVGVCATIEEVEEKSYKDKKTGEKKYYGKIILRQNLDAANLVIWNDTWANVKSCFMHKKDSIVIFAGNTKFSDYDEKNILQINKNQFVTNI